ncbi:MAG: nitrite reductase (NAD(P)H) small subunit [Pseudomonadales bacterium]|nr:nitrite reductase (NAD(P)H) small subunit [Pseudomonadales bacterium]
MTVHSVCNETDLAVGKQMAVKLENETVLLFHLEGGFFAIQNRCTHVFRSLEKGKILDGCRIQCPLHRAEFDIKSGQVVKWANFPPGIQLLNALRSEKALKTYPVKVENGQVSIEV